MKKYKVDVYTESGIEIGYCEIEIDFDTPLQEGDKLMIVKEVE